MRPPRALLLALLAVLAGPSLTARAAAPAPKVVPASADTSVRADMARKTGGSAKTLRVDGRPAARAYVRFRVRGLTDRVVRKATLWVWQPGRGPWAGLTARGVTGRPWSEKTLTWRRRPPVTPPTGEAKRGPGRWRILDVTSLVRRNGTTSVALTTVKRTGLLLAGREAGRKRAPRLHLQVEREGQPKFPIRAAFYEPDYPARWAGGTRYHPSGGRYDGGASAVQRRHLDGLAHGGLGAAITSWSGPETDSDALDARLLATTEALRRPTRWAFALTAELADDPSPTQITELLTRLDVTRGRHAAYLRVRGRPVAFVRLAASDGCDAVRRWTEGNTRPRLYLVVQAPFDLDTCDARPSDWFRLDPSRRLERVGASAVTISPGAWAARAGAASLARDLPAWTAATRSMANSRGTRWHLVSSYNDWASGTSLEPASEWASTSGWGHYLDALREASAPAAAEPPPAVVAAAGDVACSVEEASDYAGDPKLCQAEATARLVESIDPQAVLGVGDLVHGAGDYADFTQEYDPSWGRFAAKTYPTSGNHEYCDNRCLDPNAALQNGYFRYWNAKKRTSGARWYSFDVGRWHVVALDSECHRNGGCGPGSPQEQWLRRDLAANPAACTLAYWHRPYYTGGHEREWPAVRGLVQALYDNGAELILNGHQHQYERFHPQTVWRNRDESNGITQIVAGTGGRSHIPPISVRANTVVQNADTFGVLRLELGAQKFSWRFAPAPGHGSFTDAGSRSCH